MMKRWRYLVLLPLVSTLLSCGSSSSYHAYIFSAADYVSFISWDEDQGQIRGEMLVDRAQDGLISNTINGTRHGPAVSIAVAGLVPMDASLSGNTLLLRRVPGANGKIETQPQTWVSGTQTQYDQLVAAFDAYVQVSLALGILEGHLTLLPSDSDPGSLRFAEIGIHDDIASLSVGVQDVLSATNTADRCSAYILDVKPYLLDASSFQAPDPAMSTIAQNILQSRQLYERVALYSVPVVKGLVYPWQMREEDFTRQLRHGQQMLNAYALAVNQMQKDLDKDRTDYNSIVQKIDVQSLQSSCA